MTFANTRVFIGGLEGPVTKEDIEGEFAKFGKLDNVWIAQNPPGFAFIVYESEQDAEEAVNKMNGETFMGSKIRVEHSKKKRGGPRRGYGPVSRGGGSYNGGGPYNGGSSNYRGGSSNYGQRSSYGDRRDDRRFEGNRTNYNSNGNYRGGRREFRSDRNSSPPRYD